jgi:SAM-dependent methyltransferase
MLDSQDEVFIAFEGDNWFERNQTALGRFDPQSDLVIRLMELYRLHPQSVVEIGAANGYRLAAIAERFGAKVVGIEPSLKARTDGKRRFPQVEFVEGTASTIPLEKCFDVAIVNFVFHWIDRHTLLRSISEIDRIVADGGFLIIGDFYPANRTKVRYHHLFEQTIYTYKQNYSAVFAASGVYQSLSFVSGHHSSKMLDAEVPEGHAVGAWLMRKQLRDLYVETRQEPSSRSGTDHGSNDISSGCQHQ